MKRMLEAVLVLGALAIGPVLATQAQAQGAGGAGQGGGAAQAAPTNLQVLPKDTPRADVVAAMRGFTGALGVQCNYCHVMEGRGGRNDMAADEKPTKNTARLMMRLVTAVNTQIATLGKANVQKVDCGTCHRGAAEPPKFEPPPAPPAGGAGAAPGGGAPPAPGR